MAKGSNLTLPPIGSHLLDFNAVYDIGRMMKAAEFRGSKVQGKLLIEDGIIQSNGVSDDKIRALQANMGQIVDLARASKFGLESRFIELSLFDPEDPKGQSFYTVLVGQREVVARYLNQMNINLAAAAKNTARGRGALVPEGALYETPFYGARFKPAIACEDWSMDDASIFFGAYSSPPREAKPPSFDQMNNFVRVFFEDVMNNTLRSISGEAEADVALLVPIARPAGMVTVDSPNRLRGGGLFIFGKLRNERKVSASRLALYLLNSLNRAIMAVSYSSIEHLNTLDKQRADQYASEAHEVRKVIRFIDARYPPHVLEEVKHYFNTLFAATYDNEHLLDTKGILPPEFAKGDSFKEFFVNAMSVASRIELMVREMERGEFYHHPEDLQLAAAEQVSRLDFCDPCEAAPLIEEGVGWKTRWALCSTLICVLRNVIKHSRPSSSIYVDIEEGENSDKVIAVRNTARRAFDVATFSQKPAATAPGKSYEAICYLVKQYEGDLSKVAIKPETFRAFDYVTRIPFPAPVLTESRN